MNIRIRLARGLIRAGDFIRSLAVVVMRPTDLVAFSRQAYENAASITEWTQPELLNAGLRADEQALLDRLPVRKGRLLLLGAGGGREISPLARAGFTVVGLDFAPSLLAEAERLARARNLPFRGIVADLNNLGDLPGPFDVMWFSSGLYSVVPTRRQRVALLRKLASSLASSDGRIVCQFHWDPAGGGSPTADRLRRWVGRLTGGLTAYEPGDTLWGGREYLHRFFSAATINAEFRSAGFEVEWLHIPEEGVWGGAVLRAAPERR